MQTTIITALFFLAGFLIGRKMQKPSQGATPEKLSELRKEAHEAVEARMQKRKERIMARAQKSGRITNDDVEDLFCISDNTAWRYLEELEKEGKLIQHGVARGTYYTPR